MIFQSVDKIYERPKRLNNLTACKAHVPVRLEVPDSAARDW